ncbi:MAG: hypothetical protein IJB81_03635 [Clostridia bacterium]|nr:hypothetical protein [Clostridia bacterium]
MADQNRQQSGGFNPIGLCLGLGVGLCFGVAMDNIALGMCMGMGVGLCFSVALGQQKNGQQDDKNGEDQP